MSQPEWCEHIKYSGESGPYESNWHYGEYSKPIMLFSNEMFCKYCGAKRPEEKKDELEIIIFSNTNSVTYSENPKFYSGFIKDFFKLKSDILAWHKKKMMEMVPVQQFHYENETDATRCRYIGWNNCIEEIKRNIENE